MRDRCDFPSELHMHAQCESCARQLYWGLLWGAAQFYAHSLWFSICCAPWGLCTQIHHRQVRPPHQAMCACTMCVLRTPAVLESYVSRCPVACAYALIVTMLRALRSVVSNSSETGGTLSCARAPAIYSARHLVARAKLDPAVWAPVENSFGGKYNGSQSAKWAWSEVRGYASDVMQQIAGRTPLDTTSFKWTRGNCW